LSSRAFSVLSKPSARPATVIRTPSEKYLQEEELDVDIVSRQGVNLQLTDRAAEQLSVISQRESNPNAALRIAVESGGCHGYQYRMNLATIPSPGDYHLSHPHIKPSNLLVDAVSFPLLNGSTIDFATELIGSSFRVTENPHAKGAGCGCGVSWELKDSV